MGLLTALLLTASSPPVVRADRVVPSPAEARGMSAAALVDALLAPGHPAITEAAVLPQGLAPPAATGLACRAQGAVHRECAGSR